MKFWLVLSAVVLAATISGCTNKSNDVATPTLGSEVRGVQTALRQPNVSGDVLIRQKVALPADSVLTVTVSDASSSNAPSKVIAQRVMRTDGKQPPFHFVLPYNPREIQPNAHIILSAAVVVKGQLVFITENAKPVINQGGIRQDLVLIPVPSVAVPAGTGATTKVPSTSPTQVTSSVAVPAPTNM
ncbi:putative lipoprotein [Izhakiella capsodis]|uniref:Putative lipoprotein n=1 Tax=Izhakiella capsodis TaxID=1367852 RepID=A0A1I4YFB1_9GAMM|nr:YbaY family lipoprotein [Izhakiella capsodis]SFN36718.1 putative lipoprotein [Izhakiella capsodis]